MNHAVLTEHLADYLEGDLALDQRALVDAHLDTCETCAQEVREMQQTIRLLRALPQPEVPPMIAANVMRRIRAGETEPSVFERVQRMFGGVLEPSFVLPASAVAVAALVIVSIQGGGPFSRSLAMAGDSGPAPRAQRADVEREAGLVVESEEIVQGIGRGVDRAFGASVAESVSEAPRVLARSGSEAVAPAPASRQVADQTRPAAQAPRALEYAASDPMATSPSWGSRRPRATVPPSGGAGAFFGNPGLVQGFASDVSGPATGYSNRLSGDVATAMPVTLSRRMAGDAVASPDAGGEDPRDVWLARALQHPAEFAGYIALHNLAEQELWVERLTERAQSRGLLGELIEALRSAGDEKASWLAEDFAAQATTATTGESRTGIAGESGGDSSR